jgi:HlyD family secretion protein
VQTTEIRTQLVYQVRVFVCNPEDELRLGMPATVSLSLAPPAADEPERGPHPCEEP